MYNSAITIHTHDFKHQQESITELTIMNLQCMDGNSHCKNHTIWVAILKNNISH